jgi:hypothetical protein
MSTERRERDMTEYELIYTEENGETVILDPDGTHSAFCECSQCTEEVSE